MAQTCPKCGYESVISDECPRCRVIVSKYYRAYAPAPHFQDIENMGVFKRSFALFKMCLSLLAKDKEIMIFMIFPVLTMSSLVLIVAAGFFAPVFLDTNPLFDSSPHGLTGYGALFIFYVVNYFVGIFSSCALVSCAIKRFNGGDPTIGYGLSRAARKAGKILLFSMLAATVGVTLVFLERRVGWLGKIVVRILGGAWSIASMFMPPILVNEELNIRDSLKRSGKMFTETWGEVVVGTSGMGVALFLIFLMLLAPVIIGFPLSAVSNSFLPLAIGGLVWIVLVFLYFVFKLTIYNLYKAALYFYASGKKAPAEFDERFLIGAFGPRRTP